MFDLVLTHPYGWLLPLAISPLVGSFLGLVVVRWPKREPIAAGRSKCRECGRRLGVRDLIPLASWILSRGRCRVCGGRIDLVHPLVEGAAIVVAGWSVLALPGWVAWVGCGLGWALLALAAIDWREFVLPDGITLPLTAAGLAFVAVAAPADIQDHAIGAVAGFGVFAAIAALYRQWRKRAGLGFGDAKLMAAAGAWVSWTGLPSVVAIAAGVALGVVGARAVGRTRRGLAGMTGSDAIAFGPYLALGLWWVWLYGPLNLVANN